MIKRDLNLKAKLLIYYSLLLEDSLTYGHELLIVT